jgi:hypothetical protein
MMVVGGDNGSCHCKDIEANLYCCCRPPWFVCVPYLAIERWAWFSFRAEI